ncbi:hypothetical protein [Maribacter sp. 2304DJ31-5]|uniref:hypothetical protein n=1 Tax=Maribacter sp. 2304DJ31-5 TaxID=3386273 RepID=UPI0039BD2C49
MKGKFVFTTGFILIAALTWYLFIKPYDYVIRFKSKTLPDTINQTLKAWDNASEEMTIVEQENGNSIEQQVAIDSIDYIYKWLITPTKDSMSQVKIYIKDSEHSLKNRMLIPFMETDIEKSAKEKVLDFITNLKNHTKTLK